MAKPSKAAIVLNQNEWAIRLAERRAEQHGVRAPVEESNHKGFVVKVPNPSDILAWCLDEIGRQEAELSAEAQCWQDHSTKKKMLNWNNNCTQLVENIGDLLTVTNQLTHAGVKLPVTLPWNENGPAVIDLAAITQEAVEEILEAEAVEEPSETPNEV
tara:strand:+ start:153 stop:626 length:474 start_codon:yes stop_codon:yes gene_type:complete